MARRDVDVWVVADDFGYDAQIDEAIVGAFLRGDITCAALMVNINLDNTRAAVARADSVGMPLAIHAALTEGYQTVLVRKQADGEYDVALTAAKLPSKPDFWRDVDIPGRIDVDAAVAEVDRQLRLFRALTGYWPVLFTSHNHVHVAPQLAEPLARLLSSPRPDGDGTVTPMFVRSAIDFDVAAIPSDFLHRVVRDARHAATVYRTHGLRTTDYFIGCSLMGSNMSVERLRKCVDDIAVAWHNSSNGSSNSSSSSSSKTVPTVELMCHIGKPLDSPHPYADTFFMSPDRAHELTVVGQAALAHPPEHRLDILLLAPLADMTGNHTTAMDLLQVFRSLGHNVVCVNASQPAAEVRKQLLAHQRLAETSAVDGPSGLRRGPVRPIVVAIHANRGGQHLLADEITVPYAIVLGGTDINESVKQSDKCAVVAAVLGKARAVVGFTGTMVEKAIHLPDHENAVSADRCFLIPLAITIPPDIAASAATVRRGRLLGNDQTRKKKLVLVAGIRPVKDVGFLAPVMDKYDIAVCGPVLEAEYAATVLPQVRGYVGAMQRADTLRLMLESDAVVNSSRSEGMCQAILEAMKLGVPVIARSNDGNRALVRHGETGFLFETVAEFETIVDTLLPQQQLCDKVVAGSRDMLTASHSVRNVRNLYHHLFQTVFLT